MRRLQYPVISNVLIVVLMFGGIDISAADAGRCNVALVTEARMAFHRTWFEEADDLYKALIRECPDNPQHFAYAAIIDNLLFRDSANNILAAEQRILSAINSSHSFERALIYFAKGDLSLAESELAEHLEASPDDQYAQHVLGFTLIDQGRPEDGAAVLQKLIKSSPGYFPALNHLSYALMMTDEIDEALDVANAFVEADPLNPSAWDTRASILEAAGKSEDALASLMRSVLLDPRFAYGWSHIGEILLAAGDWTPAEHAFRQALEADSPYGPAFLDGEALVDSSYDHFRAGETAKSKIRARKALAIGRVTQDTSVTGGALTALCRLALRASDQSALASCSSGLLELAGDSGDEKWRVYSIHMRAEHVRMTGDLVAADALYLESLELSEAIGLTGMVAAENFNRSIVSVARGDLDSATMQVREFFRISASRNDGEPDAYGLIAFANLLMAREQAERAAIVVFAADRLFDASDIIPDPADAAPFEAVRQTVQAQLSPTQLKNAKQASVKMTTQDLIDAFL